MTTQANTFHSQTAKFLAVIISNMPELHGGEMQYYIEHPDKVQEILNVFSAPGLYRLTVNYDRSVVDAVDAGKYDWKHHNVVAEHFPAKRTGTADVEITLVKFEKTLRSDDVVKQLSTRGLRPAELPELLAFGEKYPDVQRKVPIVALGSVWDSPAFERIVPYLDGDPGQRQLCLGPSSGNWDSVVRFAAVRK